MDRAGPGESRCPVPHTLAERARHWTVYQPWLQHDPIPHFDELRTHAPIVWSEEFGGYWILTRYEDLEWAARTPEVFSNAEIGIPHRKIFPARQIPIQLDGDEHRRWRQALSDLFNPGVINHFTPQLRKATVDTIERVAGSDRCEFVGDVAVNLPAEAFLITFGIGREYLQQLLDHKDWLRREGIPNARTDEDIRQANQPLWDFFTGAIERRRAEGTEGRWDVLSRLLQSSFDGRELTMDEMVNAAFVAMLAALDTTTATLSLIFCYLAEHPQLQDFVRAHPERIPTVVEELIRTQPVSTTGRLVVRDVERCGVTLRKGDRVLMSWGMSGLDPAVFERPHEVDFDRPGTRQLAFGVGPHRCLGMHLARRVLSLAIEEWHSRIPHYRLSPEAAPRRHYSPARGVAGLELTLS
jgi:cytochrome P450